MNANEVQFASHRFAIKSAFRYITDKRRGDGYLIKISATIAATVTGKPEPLSLIAWACREADHAYPT